MSLIRYFQVYRLELLKSCEKDIDLGRWELSRTHWAIKDESIFDILVRRGIISQQQVDAALALRVPPVISPSPQKVHGAYNISQVFIVHGHDELTKLARVGRNNCKALRRMNHAEFGVLRYANTPYIFE